MIELFLKQWSESELAAIECLFLETSLSLYRCINWQKINGILWTA